MHEDDVLSAEFVLSPEEVLAEFQERCDRAALNPGVDLAELEEAAADLCRMLDRQRK